MLVGSLEGGVIVAIESDFDSLSASIRIPKSRSLTPIITATKVWINGKGEVFDFKFNLLLFWNDLVQSHCVTSSAGTAVHHANHGFLRHNRAAAKSHSGKLYALHGRATSVEVGSGRLVVDLDSI